MTRRRVVCASVIALASLILFSVTAHSPGFNNFDEGAYAEVAREMAVSGRLLTPRCNGVPYLEKPPLVYWLCAASFRAFGCTTFAGRLPVVLFTAGGIATPADAALMMQLGAEGVFVGSGIFKSADPQRFAKAIVRATTHYQDAKLLVEVSRDLGVPMRGLEMATVPDGGRMQERGR